MSSLKTILYLKGHNRCFQPGMEESSFELWVGMNRIQSVKPDVQEWGFEMSMKIYLLRKMSICITEAGVGVVWLLPFDISSLFNVLTNRTRFATLKTKKWRKVGQLQTRLHLKSNVQHPVSCWRFAWSKQFNVNKMHKRKWETFMIFC